MCVLLPLLLTSPDLCHTCEGAAMLPSLSCLLRTLPFPYCTRPFLAGGCYSSRCCCFCRHKLPRPFLSLACALAPPADTAAATAAELAPVGAEAAQRPPSACPPSGWWWSAGPRQPRRQQLGWPWQGWGKDGRGRLEQAAGGQGSQPAD
eukprot:795975-Pelagomonas_calceolata.AAC.1